MTITEKQFANAMQRLEANGYGVFRSMELDPFGKPRLMSLDTAKVLAWKNGTAQPLQLTAAEALTLAERSPDDGEADRTTINTRGAE